jgi:hypothetical protein
VLVRRRIARRATWPNGFFYRPTVLDGCRTDMRASRTSRSGRSSRSRRSPTEDEAVRIGNDTIYGLAGAVWTRTPARPSGWPRGCGTERSGSTTTTPTCPRPSGAASSSPGIGRELGPPGLAEYREAKHIYQNIAAGQPSAGSAAERAVDATTDRPPPPPRGPTPPPLSVRNLWKVFGPGPRQIVGTPDAALPTAELQAKTGTTLPRSATSPSTSPRRGLRGHGPVGRASPPSSAA